MVGKKDTKRRGRDVSGRSHEFAVSVEVYRAASSVCASVCVVSLFKF
jgi:hypothetical protein